MKTLNIAIRDLCHSKLFGLHPVDNMVIWWVKNSSSTETWAVSLGHTDPWVDFLTHSGNLFIMTNDTPRDLRDIGTSGISCMTSLAFIHCVTLKLPQYCFYLLVEKPLVCYFQVSWQAEGVQPPPKMIPTPPATP